MKKLFFILSMMMLISLSSLAQIDPITIGSSPNDGRGDNLREAFEKVNVNDAYLDTMGVQRLDSLLDAGMDEIYGIAQAVLTDGGVGSDYYSVTIPGVTSYINGSVFMILFSGSDVSANFMNINGLGTRAIYGNLGSSVGLVGSSLVQGQIGLFIYGSSCNCFQIMNPNNFIPVNASTSFNFIDVSSSVSGAFFQLGNFPYGDPDSKTEYFVYDLETPDSNSRILGMFITSDAVRIGPYNMDQLQWEAPLKISEMGWMYIENLPTVNPCATRGANAIWNDAGALKICP